jgi:hypothetical protein
MGAKETDVEDKVDPTVTYLQKLGPEYLDLIFEGSKWVIALDKEKGLQVSQVRYLDDCSFWSRFSPQKSMNCRGKRSPIF